MQPNWSRQMMCQVRTTASDIHRHDNGMMTFANCVCCLLFALMIAFTINSAHIQNKKIARQNAADAVAQSAGVWMARGMNAVTATNHVMGEMLSFVIIHEAIGGKKLDSGTSADDGANRSVRAEDPQSLKSRDQELFIWYQAVQFISPADSDVFDAVYERDGDSKILAEAMLLDAKMDLKQWLIKVYQGYATAYALKQIGYTYAAGEALEKAMQLLELKIMQESLVLSAVDGIAQTLVGPKQILRDQLLPEAKAYTTRVKDTVPTIAREAAVQLGKENGVESEVFPTATGLRLPIKIDPLALLHDFPDTSEIVPERMVNGCGCPSDSTPPNWDRVSKMTQLARASFPWVNYHREPILNILGATMHLAKAEDYYFHWSNGYSKFIVQEQQPQGDTSDESLALYVLEGYDGPDKGYERWNIAEHSEDADDLFSVVGLAHHPAPSVIGVPIFDQQHASGMMSYAMALLYNGNEQQRPNHRIDQDCKRIVPIRQANVGMDTLNWFPGSNQESNGCETTPNGSDNRPFELLGIKIPAEYPRIRVNWQSKLVPATGHRLSQLKQAPLSASFKAGATRMLDFIPNTLTTH